MMWQKKKTQKPTIPGEVPHHHLFPLQKPHLSSYKMETRTSPTPGALLVQPSSSTSPSTYLSDRSVPELQAMAARPPTEAQHKGGWEKLGRGEERWKQDGDPSLYSSGWCLALSSLPHLNPAPKSTCVLRGAPNSTLALCPCSVLTVSRCPESQR